MNTQQNIDLNTVREHAAELGLDCEIVGDSSGITITMETGEVEQAPGLPRAIEIINAYAALA